MVTYNSRDAIFIHIFVFFIMILTIGCTPPENPINCSSSSSSSKNSTICTITNSYGSFPDRSKCRASQVFYPNTEEELISIVANATMLKKKMKVATIFSHSIPKLVCPDDGDGDGGGGGILISTKNLNRVLRVEEESRMSMIVESGVTLRELIKEAADAKMALPYTPYWWGLTIGGLMGTGGHGSTLWGKGSSVHDYVTELRIVTPATAEEGYAKVRVVRDGDPDLNAVRVSLGVLGVISQVTVKVEPMFKRAMTLLTKNDSDLSEEALSFGKKHEFADIIWYPSQHKVVYRIDDRVPSNTSGNGRSDFTGFRSTPSLLLSLLRTTEEDQESRNDATGKCINGRITTGTLIATAYGYTNDGIAFTKFPIIGYNNRLQASGTCLDSPEDGKLTVCPWDPRVKGLFFYQTTFSISLSKVKSFIQDVQRLVSIEPKSLCGLDLYNGILMRYVTASNAYLGKQEDALDFDITYFRHKEKEEQLFPPRPRMYEDVLEEIEQMAMFKYGGLPHWGKNRNVAFVGAIGKYRKGNEFLKVKERFDPLGLFSSEWSDNILGVREGITMEREGCGVEGLCLCSKDSHCAPEKGYFCRAGKVYKDARVCTRLSSP